MSILNECPICLDDLEEKRLCILECKHKFHENCITIYVLSNRDKVDKICCPLCRHKINVIIEEKQEEKCNTMFIITCVLFLISGFLIIYCYH
jgi:uncharacterized protein YbaR (Trm112 family)